LNTKECNKFKSTALLYLAHESGGLAEDFEASLLGLGGQWGVRWKSTISLG